MMKNGSLAKTFIYFLCFSFFVMMSGFQGMMAEARGNLPIGEMVSKGDVKFEVRENAWKNVEPSNFSLFQGTRVKTEKGVAVLTLSDNTRIDVGQKSLFSIDRDGRLVLTQGGIQFRIPSTSDTSFKVGNISVAKSRSLQASKAPVPSKDEEAIGSISIHPNGAVTVKTVQGKLSVQNQDRVVLAGLSSKDSVTIPSTTVKSPSKTMVAQVNDGAVVGGEDDDDDGWKILGLPWWAVLLGGAAVGGGIAVAASGSSGGGTDRVICR